MVRREWIECLLSGGMQRGTWHQGQQLVKAGMGLRHVIT